MSRNKKIIRNIIVLCVLLFVLLKITGLYLSPISVHKSSERSIHFGPSDIIHIEDFDGGKYILCKYDKWVSCNTIKRTLFLFWSFGGQEIGFENDKTKAIDYTWNMSKGDYYKLYGIINDNKIAKVEINLNNGIKFTESKFYEDLFLFTWQADLEDQDWYLKNIKGFDSDNNIIFQKEY